MRLEKDRPELYWQRRFDGILPRLSKAECIELIEFLTEDIAKGEHRNLRALKWRSFINSAEAISSEQSSLVTKGGRA